MSEADRTLYLICYDVSEDKLRRRVQRFLTGYKIGGQKSFFECLLTPTELRDVGAALGDLIDHGQDRVHIFQLDPRSRRDMLGLARQPPLDVFLIV